MKMRLEFKLQDLWIGAFWKVTVEGRPYYSHDEYWHHRFDLWIFLIPTLPLHVTWRVKKQWI